MAGWLDNYGKDENPNNSKVTTPKGFVGEGNFNGPMFKNPAWKGQFKDGGSMPGSVGFSYARVGAPSEGKYAKKTMASAQDGDKLVSIEDLIKETEKRKAQKTQPKPKEQPKVVKETTKIDRRKVQKESDLTPQQRQMLIQQRNIEQSGDIRVPQEYPWYEKARDIALNPLTAAGYKARGEDIPENFAMGPRNAYDYPIDVVNPLQIANSAVMAPVELGKGNIGTAGLHALTVLPFMRGTGIGNTLTRSAAEDLRNLGAFAKDLPKAKSFKEAFARTRGIPLESSLPRMGKEELKVYRQIQDVARLKAEGKPISQQYQLALDQNIPEEHLQKMFGRTRQEIEERMVQPEALPSGRIDLTRNRAPRSTSAPTSGGIPQAERDRLRAMMRQWDDEITSPTPAPAVDREALRSRMRGWGADMEAQPIQSTIPSQTEQNTDLIDEFFESGPGETAARRWRQEGFDPNSPHAEEATRYLDRTNRAALENISEDEMGDLIRRAVDRGRGASEEGWRTSRLSQGLTPEMMDDLMGFRVTTRGETVNNLGGLTEKPSTLSGAIAQNNMRLREGLNQKMMDMSQNYPYYSGPVQENVPSLMLTAEGNLKNVSDKVARSSSAGVSSGDIYTGSLNTSHNSYIPQIKKIFDYKQGSPLFVGYRPMNELGFLSNYGYNSDDVARYMNTEIDDLIRRGKLPKDIQRPHVKGENVMLPHYGIKQHAHGGVVKDDRGQWAYPGEITEIDSNDITMRGVPYDVMGISDTGDMKLMKPGNNYKFKGKKVTEFPVGKNGEELQKLDQLTNFTNYNKPQPGGWLDKYQ